MSPNRIPRNTGLDDNSIHNVQRGPTLLSEQNNEQNFMSFKHSHDGKALANEISHRSTEEKVPTRDQMIELQSLVIQRDNEVN